MEFKIQLESQTEASLATAHPHEPHDLDASLTEYLRDRLSAGWTLAGVIPYGNGWKFVFTSTA